MYILSVLSVVGLGFWAYTENYKTQAALDEVDDLRRDIGVLMDRRAVLRAEWAYLNRPDRLRELVVLNYQRLELLPLQPDQFGQVDQVSFPIPPSRILSPIDLSSQGADQ